MALCGLKISPQISEITQKLSAKSSLEIVLLFVISSTTFVLLRNFAKNGENKY